MKELIFDVLYAGGLLAASPYFLYKMLTAGKYRAGLGEKLGFIDENAGDGCIWVHGVSVGEILAARSVVEGLRTEFPGVEVVISTTTNTGYAVARKTYSDLRVFYYPLDFSSAVKRTFRRIRPRMVILLELEVWPNFLRRAERLGIPVFVANGRMTEKSFMNYKRFKPLVISTLSRVTLYLMQTEAYRERLLELGVPSERVEVAGNVKFDTVSTESDLEASGALRRELGVAEDETLIIGGSTHATEEKALLDAYAELKKTHPGVRLLIVPRHKERFYEVAGIIRAARQSLLRRSIPGETPRGGEVILGDTMGELERLYDAADVAFVGGTLIPHGGQNMLEPAAKGKPVVFGPSVENFPVASRLLLDAGAATCIADAGGLRGALEAYLDPEKAAEAGKAGREAAIAAKGATARTLRRIREVYERETSLEQ